MKMRFPLLVCSLVVCMAALTLHVWAGSNAAEDKAPRWEHLALTHDSADVGGDVKLSQQIVRLGNEGWELVTVSPVSKEGSTVKTIFFFKRPK